MPIVVDARVWGGLYATRFAGQPRFAATDVDFAAAVATQVAAGVVQADHFARIERLAFQDPLTGLANRRAVDDRLEAEHGPRRRRTAPPVSVVLADINRLKQVNDSFGHEAGDRLIVAVGRGGQPGQRAGARQPGGADRRRRVLHRRQRRARRAGRAGRRGAVPAGRRPADEHRRVLRGRVHRLAAGHVDTPLRLFRLADAAQYRAKRAGLRRPVVAGQARGRGPRTRPADRRARRGRLAVDGSRRCSSRGWRCSTARGCSGRRPGSRRWPTTCCSLARRRRLVGLRRAPGGDAAASA